MTLPIVPLQRALEHLRLDDDAEDLALVEELLLTAEEHVSTYLQRPLKPWKSTQAEPPRAVQPAMLLHLADLYENRSAQVEKALSLNPTVDRLLYPHRLNIGI